MLRGLSEAKQADPVTVKNFHLFPKGPDLGPAMKNKQAASFPHLLLLVT